MLNIVLLVYFDEKCVRTYCEKNKTTDILNQSPGFCIQFIFAIAANGFRARQSTIAPRSLVRLLPAKPQSDIRTGRSYWIQASLAPSDPSVDELRELWPQPDRWMASPGSESGILRTRPELCGHCVSRTCGEAYPKRTRPHKGYVNYGS